MSRMRLSEESLPVYVDMKPVRRMGEVVKNLAVIKKATAELAAIEMQLESSGEVTVEDLNLAKKEMAKFAKIIAKNAKSGAGKLKVLKKDILAYRKELLNAIG